jgi:putative transposase
MTDKFQNKYRIQSNRMPQWDYSGNGIYFITIVTQNRDCNLGNIVVDTHGRAYLQYSDFGKIVNDEWLKSFEMRNELFLDEYIIMPNHLHAILVLDKNHYKQLYVTNGTNDTNVETHGRASLQTTEQTIEQTNFIRKPRSISSFVAGFKSAINSKIDDFIDVHHLDIPKYNRNNHFFQPNYHDHIIRNDSEYQRIKEYIINNPTKWKNDSFNPTNKITEE